MDAKSSKIQKSLHFTYFDQKNTYISGCKIVHKCTIATVIVHICTVTVALAFIILIISSLSLSLGFGQSHLTLPFFIWSNHASIVADLQTIATNK